MSPSILKGLGVVSCLQRAAHKAQQASRQQQDHYLKVDTDVEVWKSAPATSAESGNATQWIRSNGYACPVRELKW